MLKIGDLHINNIPSEKLLAVNFDCKLKFNKHSEEICQKASQKLNALKDLHHTYKQPKNVFLCMRFSGHNLIFAH